jgi:hypothetical protein
MNIHPRSSPQKKVFLLIFCFFLLAACISHLRDAKFYYSQGQALSRQSQKEKAIAFYKRALEEAKEEAEKHPSAQAYLLKGMAELNLELWKDAEASFLEAFSYGFEEGEEWASEVSLLGLASSLQGLGLKNLALKSYSYLLDKSKLKPAALYAAQKYTDLALAQALLREEKEKQRNLNELLKKIENLSDKDFGCGFYHYLQSQILSHLAEYKKSFEEAVMARELGLSSEKIFRDNDLQIVFCYEKLKSLLPAEEWKEFESHYQEWIKKWGWKDSQTPGWKKESKNAADN